MRVSNAVTSDATVAASGRFADHPLADIGVIGHRRRVERLERQAAGPIFVAIVVAADAVGLDERVLLDHGHRR